MCLQGLPQIGSAVVAERHQGRQRLSGGQGRGHAFFSDLTLGFPDLIAFMEGSGHSPRYTLWFCVGELWPQDQPWVKRLVMVKVVPTCLKELLEMAREGGASSLKTVDLHISNSQPISLTSDQYKACLQDLVEDMDFQATGDI